MTLDPSWFVSTVRDAGLYETSGDWLYEVGLPGRAASAAASSRCPPARAASARSRLLSMRPATACAESSPHVFSRARSGSTSSRQSRLRGCGSVWALDTTTRR